MIRFFVLPSPIVNKTICFGSSALLFRTGLEIREESLGIALQIPPFSPHTRDGDFLRRHYRSALEFGGISYADGGCYPIHCLVHKVSPVGESSRLHESVISQLGSPPAQVVPRLETVSLILFSFLRLSSSH